MIPTHELLALKLLVITVLTLASIQLHRSATRSVRLSGEWYAGHSLSILLGILAISELAHGINLIIRGL